MAINNANASDWSNAQITEINNIANNSSTHSHWAVVGDFNAVPDGTHTAAPPVGDVIHGDRATQQSGNLLDYMITNAPAGFTPSDGGVAAICHWRLV